MKVGVLGGGQLGQMLTIAGYPIGVRVTCFDRSLDVPANLVGAVYTGELSETRKLHRWASHVDVLTYEFENFPAELVADLGELRPMYPGTIPLAIAQDRWAEKRLLAECGMDIAPFRAVTTANDLTRAIDELGLPLVAKTRSGGYDGKGQTVITRDDDLSEALDLLSQSELIVEDLVAFDCEVSVIGVRGRSGEIRIYPVTENEHRGGILRVSRVPARVSAAVEEQAHAHMTALLKRLDYVGVLALELFSVKGRLFANEFAPRVHNSGHWTIEGAETSQFENHLRAIAGLPLGSTDMRSPTAMLNIIGAMPAVADVLAVDGAHLHVYGKDPRPGRKLGHITVTGHDDETVRRRLAAVDAAVHPK